MFLFIDVFKQDLVLTAFWMMEWIVSITINMILHSFQIEEGKVRAILTFPSENYYPESWTAHRAVQQV